jgi:hypothetical protein
MIDLGATHSISRVRIQWETAFAKAFSLQVSEDQQGWAEVYRTEQGKGGVSEIKFAPVFVRWVRLNCSQRGTQWGNAVRELEVFGPAGKRQALEPN